MNFNSKAQTVSLDGVKIPPEVLRVLAEARPDQLFRFEQRAGTVMVVERLSLCRPLQCIRPLIRDIIDSRSQTLTD